MRKVFFAFLFGISLIGPLDAKSNDWKEATAKVKSAVVPIKTEDGSCTGFVINVPKKYVLTAAHCNSDEKMWVDRVLATTVSFDEDKDLIVLEVKNLDPAKTALQLATEPVEVMDDVMSVGYGYGLERPQFRAAKISDTAMIIKELSGPFIAVNVAFTPGQSGGPVVNASGEVVSIVQKGDEGTLGFGVGAKTIREVMGRFWEK